VIVTERRDPTLDRELDLAWVHPKRSRVADVVDMRERTVDLPFRMLGQNQGCLSKRASNKELPGSSAAEVAQIGQVFGATFPRRS
jgi:hypothetical protein